MTLTLAVARLVLVFDDRDLRPFFLAHDLCRHLRGDAVGSRCDLLTVNEQDGLELDGVADLPSSLFTTTTDPTDTFSWRPPALTIAYTTLLLISVD